MKAKPSLDWFLEGWVNGTSLPRLELQGVKFTAKANAAAVSGVILQKDAPEDLVTFVPVYAVVSGKAPVLVGRVFADGARDPVSFIRTGWNTQAPAGSKRNRSHKSQISEGCEEQRWASSLRTISQIGTGFAFGFPERMLTFAAMTAAHKIHVWTLSHCVIFLLQPYCAEPEDGS